MDNKKRYEEIDILKGIGIFLMVFDHVYFGKYLHLYIQSFHMPLFFIVSGYLWKNNYTMSEKIKKRFKTLLIPYIFFGTIYLLLHIILNGINFQTVKAICLFPTDMVNMPFAPALWFLPCMFFTDIFYTALNKIKNNRLLGCVILIIAIIGSVYSLLNTPMLPLSLEPVMTALLFWHIGHCVKQYTEKRNNVKILNIELRQLIILFFISLLFAFLNRSIDMRSARYHIVPLYFLNGVLGTLTYWNISNRIKITNNKYMKVFNNGLKYLGKNSMVFICMNQVLIIIANNIIQKFFVNNVMILNKIFTLVFTIIMCVIFNYILSYKKFKFIIGK